MQKIPSFYCSTATVLFQKSLCWTDEPGKKQIPGHSGCWPLPQTGTGLSQVTPLTSALAEVCLTESRIHVWESVTFFLLLGSLLALLPSFCWNINVSNSLMQSPWLGYTTAISGNVEICINYSAQPQNYRQCWVEEALKDHWVQLQVLHRTIPKSHTICPRAHCIIYKNTYYARVNITKMLKVPNSSFWLFKKYIF